MEMTFNDRDAKNTTMPLSKNNRYRDAIATGDRNNLNANELASAFKTEHKAWKDRKDYQEKIMMKGRSHYRLPDKRALKQHYN